MGATKTRRRGRRTYSADEVEAARARDAELTHLAATALADPAEMGDITTWLLTVKSSIRGKSLRNQTLLFKQAQARGATVTDVRTFRQWIDAGRCPLKGTAYRITAPKGTEADDSTPADEAPAATAGEENPTRTRFRMVPVFDIADTKGVEDFDGDPLPVPDVDLWVRLAEQITERGYEILRAGDGHGVDHEARTVTIAVAAAPEAATAALGVQLAAVITHQRATKPGPVRPQAVEELPAGVQAADLTLGEAYGVARVTVETNWDNGRTRYQVTARNVTGTLTVQPERNTADANPGRADIMFGDVLTGPNWVFSREMHQSGTAPIVNGVELEGGVTGVSRGLVEDVDQWRWSVRPQRYLTDYTSMPAPDATADRFRAVVRAVLLHWFDRADLAEVRLAAARHEAPNRLADRNAEAARLDQELAKLQAQRDQVAAQVQAINDVAGPDLPAATAAPSPAPPPPAPEVAATLPADVAEVDDDAPLMLFA